MWIIEYLDYDGAWKASNPFWWRKTFREACGLMRGSRLTHRFVYRCGGAHV